MAILLGAGKRKKQQETAFKRKFATFVCRNAVTAY